MAKKKTATTPRATKPAGTKKKAVSKTSSGSKKRYFEFVQGNSSKFWEIELSGKSQTVRYGRIGTDGQSKTTNFGDVGKAKASYEKLIDQKLKKGYIESRGKRKSPTKKSTTAKKVAAQTVPTKKKSTKKQTGASKAVGGAIRWRQEKRGDKVQFQATLSKQPSEAEVAGALDDFWKKVWQSALEVETGSDTILLVCELSPDVGRIAGYRALRGIRYLKTTNLSVAIYHPDIAKQYDKLSDFHAASSDREFEKLYNKLTGEILSWLKASAKSMSKADPSFAKRASVFWIDSPEEITPKNVSWLCGKKFSAKKLAEPEVETAFPACIEAIFRSLRMRAAKREENFLGTNLYLGGTATNDKTLSLLTEMPEVGHLSLSFTSVSDLGMKYVTRLPNLETLSLSNTKVTDKGLKECAKLKKLEDLDLRGLSISGKGLRHLESLQAIWTLDLGETGLTDGDLKPLLKLKNLSFLNLVKTRITDKGVQDLAKIKSLEFLDLSDTKITDACIGHLLQLPNLDTLYVSRTKITADGFARLEAQISDCRD